MCCCRPRPGARRTAPSPIRSGASRASASSCRCPARRGPTGASSPTWRSAWDLTDAFAYRSVADVFREHAALSAFENDGARGVRSRRAGGDLGPGLRGAGAGAVAGPGRVAATPSRLLGDGGFFTADRKARFIAPERAGAGGAGQRRISAASEHRAAARPVAYHDAVGPEPDARRAPAGAVRRSPSRRRRSATACATTASPACSTAHGALHPQGCMVTDAAAARLDLRADPLERSQRLVGADRRSGGARTDPFSGQPEAKATPAAVAPVEFAWRGFALSRRPLALPAGTWWTRIALPDASGCTFATNESLMTWHDLAPQLFPTRC